MKTFNLTLPQVIFVYTAIVLAVLACLCLMHLDKCSLEQDLQKWQEEAAQLKNELAKIKRLSDIYSTSPEIIAVVLRESERHTVNPGIMLELIKAESSFNPNATSKDGAKGLCQLKPSTAKELCQELDLFYDDIKLEDIEFNIQLGTYYLAKLLKANNNDYHRALTAYNRGPWGMENYLRTTGTAVSSYSEKIKTNSHLVSTMY